MSNAEADVATSINTGKELKTGGYMDISELKDPRDREHATRDIRATSIHNFRNETQARSNRQDLTDMRTAGYDTLADYEFNKGLRP